MLKAGVEHISHWVLARSTSHLHPPPTPQLLQDQSWVILIYLESLAAMKANRLSSGSNLLLKLVPMELSLSIS